MKTRLFKRKQTIKTIQKFGIGLCVLLISSGLGFAQHWEPAPPFPGSGAAQAILTPVGNVLVQEITGPSGTGTGNWYVLQPDASGNYTTGFWAGPISTPSGYAPEFFGSAVLPDGRVLIEGGEYNFGTQSETNQGSLFDPISGTFSSLVAAPSGWADIGDAPTVILPNGKFMLGDCCSSKEAIFDASSLTWSSTGSGKADSNSEEGWTLLPNKKVLTIDTQNGSNTELYDYTTGKWTSAGNTPQPLAYNCGNPHEVPELGPAVLRPGGTVFAAGANGLTAIYNVAKNKWSKGPIFPPNSAGLGQDGVADGPAAILPDGNVLVMASNINPCNVPPSDFYEFNGTSFITVPSPPNAVNDISYYGRMVVLPNSHVLLTDNSTDVEIYFPAGSPKSAWLPKITSYPKTITQGGSYTLKGTRFNGLSQGAAYGDDAQSATNFPIVKIEIGGFTYYLPTKNFTSGVATGSAIVSTDFSLPFFVGTGPAKLVLLANGLASNTVNITVK